MTELKNNVPSASKGLPTVKQFNKMVSPIFENNLDHSYCVNVDNLVVNKVAIDCIQNSIINEEVIIPDLIEENVNQNIHLDSSDSQISKLESTKREIRILVPRKSKKKIDVSDKINSCSKVNVNTSSDSRNNLRLFANTIIRKENTVQSQAKVLTISDPIEITLEQYYNLSSLKSGNIQVSSILKLPISKSNQSKPVIQIDNAGKSKSTVHVLSAKEKQVATNNKTIEVKKEAVKVEEQIANRNKRFYHVVCLTCKKLRESSDTSSRCQVCQNIFQYECLRCRDILSSKDEYYNHLKTTEFCPEIQVPLFLKNNSYALATVLERNQCFTDEWERVQKLLSIVKISRRKSINGKFRRIKLCCPICDKTFPVENGNFWCGTCETSSVFKCQTCNRNYTTYCGAIYHTENHMIKKPIYECYHCSFKHKTKRVLFTHIRHEHLQNDTQKKKPKKKVFQCPDCNLIITRKSYRRKHEYSCRKKIYFKCTLCTEKYLAKEEMRLHLLAAHKKTDSQALELIKEIEEEKNNQEENIKLKNREELAEEEPSQKRKKTENNYNKSKLHYMTPYCIDCDETYQHLKISSNNNCPKCKSTAVIQCTFCNKSFKKYMAAYYHVTKKCEKIKAKLKEKNGGSAAKSSKAKKQEKMKDKTNRRDMKSNNGYPQILFQNPIDTKLENNSTLEDTKMDTDIDIKLENQDIKYFDCPFNLDKDIIPDKVD